MGEQRAPIFVVDDDPDLRELLGELLAEEGYMPSLLENGRKALDLLDSGVRPALILLDLMMPEMNGWQFLEAQRGSERFRDIPVVVMTASRGFEDGSTAGIEILYKPVALEQLLEAIERRALRA